MGWTLKTLVRNGSAGLLVAGLLGLFPPVQSNAQTLYNINFSQFAGGSVYSNASGPPTDFSSYFAGGSDPSGVGCYISSSGFLATLTNQALVCGNAGDGVGNFVMSMGNVSSNAVTLTMLLQLDTGVGATVSFGQSGPPGSNATSVTLSYPNAATNTVQVQSVDGPTNSSALLYSFGTSLARPSLQNISFTLNLPAHTFSLSVNGVSFANNAPVGFAQPINQAAIAIGDIDNIVRGNIGAIANIALVAGPAATILDIFPSGPNVMVGLITSTNAYYDIQATTSLVSPTWSTIYSNVHGTGGLTNFICGSSATPQQFYRACAHP